jgi:hypothetical protein
LHAVPKAPIKVPKKRDTTWVQPKLIAKVEYRDITVKQVRRHGVLFAGLAKVIAFVLILNLGLAGSVVQRGVCKFATR